MLFMTIFKRKLRSPVLIFNEKLNWTPKKLLRLLVLNKFENINLKCTELYLANTDDIRKCPNEKWTNYGYIILRPCNKPLKWDKWENEWSESAQMTESFKIVKSIKKSLNDVLYGSSWPQWNLAVYRENNCSQIVWPEWEFEFWWFWLGHYPEFKHTEATFWSLRRTIKTLMLFLFLIVIYLRIYQMFSFVESIHSFICQVLMYSVVPNLFGLWLLIEILFITLCINWFRNSSSIIEKLLSIPLLVCWVVYPVIYFKLCLAIWNSFQYCFILKVLMYEAFAYLLIIIINLY